MMDERLKIMLQRYQCDSKNDYENALKEIIQEIALLGLWRSKFFEQAAFYGGTALRILYGLDRFSEDLDFTLLKPNKTFGLTTYNAAIKSELQSFGFSVEMDTKNKINQGNIKAAMIRTSVKQQFIMINAPDALIKKLHNNRLLKIKMEVDVNPPGNFETEARLLLQPIPFSVNTLKMPDLFAGKVHAVLCHSWQDRVKGRDWYDLVWYISRETSVSLKHLRERLIQSGDRQRNHPLTKKDVIDLLNKKIDRIDFQAAKADVLPFIRDHESVRLWSKAFFLEVISRMRMV